MSEENMDGCALDFEAEAITDDVAESLLVPAGEEDPWQTQESQHGSEPQD